tara:strand:+ start:102 stop:530 length:429 start_codon:yes stop_codon:yes gene_type:complete
MGSMHMEVATFKKLILAWVGLTLGHIVVTEFSMLDEGLVAIEEQLDPYMWPIVDDDAGILIWFAIFLITAIAHLVSLVLLYRLRRNGKRLFVITTILLMILPIPIGPFLTDSILGTIGFFGSAAAGLIFYGAFHTKLSEEFI